MPFDFEARIVRLLHVSTVLSLVDTLIINVDGGAISVLARHELPYGTPTDSLNRQASRSRRRRYILIHEQMVIIVCDANALLSHSVLRCHTSNGFLCVNDRIRVRKD